MHAHQNALLHHVSCMHIWQISYMNHSAFYIRIYSMYKIHKLYKIHNCTTRKSTSSYLGARTGSQSKTSSHPPTAVPSQSLESTTRVQRQPGQNNLLSRSESQSDIFILKRTFIIGYGYLRVNSSQRPGWRRVTPERGLHWKNEKTLCTCLTLQSL